VAAGRVGAIAALISTLFLLGAAQAAAKAPAQSSYLDAVQLAYALIKDATPNDLAPAEAAANVLSNTDEKPQEIIADLTARPPLYADARTRLVALMTALKQPATTADPELANQRLHEILSMSRYDALRRPPSPLDRFAQWVRDRINALLRFLLNTTPVGGVPLWVFYTIGAVVIAAAAFLVFRAARGRFSESMAALPSGPRPAADYFAEADRLASKGDRVGAIRALCAAVAATLAGERSWEGSSLTVREIFQRAPDFATLRPLLLPFEAAIYGGRDVDQATYERAARIAAQFRPQVQVAA
jgi:hypothetical protein